MGYPLIPKRLSKPVDFRADYTGFKIKHDEPGGESHTLTQSTILPLILEYADKDCPPRKR